MPFKARETNFTVFSLNYAYELYNLIIKTLCCLKQAQHYRHMQRSKRTTIHRKEKDGDWCFAHKNSKRAYKNGKKNCESSSNSKRTVLLVQERLPLNLIFLYAQWA